MKMEIKSYLCITFSERASKKAFPKGLFYGVMVALEFLVLSVVVRIRLEQQLSELR